MTVILKMTGDTTATTARAESWSLADLNGFDLFKDGTLTELTSIVELCRALGGGWNQ